MNWRKNRKSEIGKRKLNLPALDEQTKRKGCDSVLKWQYAFEAATQRDGQVVGHGVAAAGGGIGRRGGANFASRGLTIQEPDQREREHAKPKLTAAETGTAHHKFLQHVALEKADDLAALEAEAAAAGNRRSFVGGRTRGLGFGGAGGFLEFRAGPENSRPTAGLHQTRTAVHGKIQPGGTGRHHRRKTPPGLENEFVVVQGVADLVVLLPEEIWLVDFKTDEVSPNELAERRRHYEPQLKLYAARVGENLFAAGHKLLAAFSRPSRQTVNVKI